MSRARGPTYLEPLRPTGLGQGVWSMFFDRPEWMMLPYGVAGPAHCRSRLVGTISNEGRPEAHPTAFTACAAG